MTRPATLALAAALVAVLATPPAARESRTERVAFPAGTTGTTIEGSITGYEAVDYLVGAEAGQRMMVTLETGHTATYFNVYEPGKGPGEEALAVSQFGGVHPMVPDINRFDATLPTSGDYTISVYMMRSAARRDETAEYRLRIEIPAAQTMTETVERDYADGLQGGPDFWQVRLADRTSRLNVHSGPSAGAPVIGRLAHGKTLRNAGGCRMAEGRRWCDVSDTRGLRGWVAGAFLIEAAPPAPDRPVLPAHAAVPSADPVDGAAPAFVVRLANRGGLLNMHGAPSAAAPVIAQLPFGATVRNAGGCTVAEGRRWCDVADARGHRGWVAAQFLVPGETDVIELHGSVAFHAVEEIPTDLIPADSGARAASTVAGTMPEIPEPHAGRREIPSGTPPYFGTFGASAVAVRAAPEAGAQTVFTVMPGTVLRNLGCEGAWCEVGSVGDDRTGWAEAAWLEPAESALRAGQGVFDATGLITCTQAASAPARDCAFGVARDGGGSATLVVIRPDGMRRALFFENGAFVSTDASQAGGGFDTEATRAGDTTIVRIDDERYEIPDAALYGG
ncbi:SH3 domain-containing protein [Rhodosalinus halophilus]|nr:SH3 domain-containing protein [Rhodosalinus halophilus]